MVTDKKKPPWLFIGIGLIPVAFLAYLVNGAWENGMNIVEFFDAFDKVCSNMFTVNYFKGYDTIRAVIFGWTIYAVVLMMYYTSQRNLMPGKEYGTAKFADIGMVNKVISDREEDRNRILSQNVRMSLDTRKTKLNNNVLIIGGSGAGKTFYEVKPNLMQMPKNCSFICTDPKGEILRSCGDMLKKNGYNVKVINLIDMDKSDCYNPFEYIREETDVIKLITNLIANTTPKDSASTDPFWDKAEGMFLQSLFYYVWMEMPKSKRNFETVLKLIAEAEVTEKNKKSPLTKRMEKLAKTSKYGVNHPAYKQYMKVIKGAGDTVRSIIITANSRLAPLENEQVLRFLSKDELKLEELGIGVNGDETTKTALFCVIPDSDKSYNFIIGMLYTQIFQELYYQADFNYGGRLPIHVTFMLDEFANVALPDDYCSLLSTMRSREISSIIIIQNLAQIKALFKDTWETIPGNCDTLIYLGGNEQSTHKYISELLGKSTIDKRATGETRGRQGSSSRNYDVLGRELMTPDEARKFDNKKCLIFIRGFDPIVDDKYFTPNHPAFLQSADGEGIPYEHVSSYKNEVSITNNDSNSSGGKLKLLGTPFQLLTPQSVKYFEKLESKGENVQIATLTFDEVMIMSEVAMKKEFQSVDEKEQLRKATEESGNEIVYKISDGGTEETYITRAGEKNPQGKEIIDTKENSKGQHSKKSEVKKQKYKDSIVLRLSLHDFSEEQRNEAMVAMSRGVPTDVILTYFYPEIAVSEMRKRRDQYLQSVR